MSKCHSCFLIKFSLFVYLGALLTVSILSGCSRSSDIPSKEKVAASVKAILPVNHTIVSVKPMKDVPGVIEIVAKVDKQGIVFYVDRSLKYVFSGSVMEISTKKNLTVEAQKAAQ